MADAALTDALREKLAQLAHRASELAGDARPRLLLGHFSVAEAVPGGDERILAGRDIPVPLDSLTGAGWDYVALGHLHRHRDLTANISDAPPVVYAGSLESAAFGESDAKGFCLAEVARGAANWRFVGLNARKRLTLRVDCRDDDEPTRTTLEALKQQDLRDAIVRLEVLLTPESEARLRYRAINDALKQAGAFHSSTTRKVAQREDRARLGADADGFSEIDLLARYFAGRGETAERQAALLQKAREIMAADPR